MRNRHYPDDLITTINTSKGIFYPTLSAEQVLYKA
jgi:hypothetical protein